METMEGGIIEQIAVTKGGVARTACGSFPGIYTRLDDPEVFRWMQSVIFGIVPTTTSIPEPCGILSRDGTLGLFGKNQVSFFLKKYIQMRQMFQFCLFSGHGWQLSKEILPLEYLNSIAVEQ